MIARRRVFWVAGVLGLLAVALGLALGVGRGGQAQEPNFGYPVKYLCGLSVTTNLAGEVIVTDFRTAVNVHNPNPDPVAIDKKAVPSLSQDNPGEPGERIYLEIPPDGAFEIDCPDIISLLELSPSATGEGGGPVTNCVDGVDNAPLDGLVDFADPNCFQTGFVFVRSEVEIDVVDVETAQRVIDAGTPGVGHSIEVDTIEARSLPPEAAPDETMAIYYSAKFVCGTADVVPGVDDPLVSGTYGTTVSVHNPGEDSAGVMLQKKVVLALPEAETQLPPTRWYSVALGPDGAFEVDCVEIGTLLVLDGLWAPPPNGPAFFKGWVVFQSPAELDVVGVYSTTENAVIGAGGGVGLKIDKEPVKPRMLPRGTDPTPTPGPATGMYYKCYDLLEKEPLPLGVIVDLRTQFGDELGVELLEPTALCAPALMNDNGNPLLPDIKCYDIYDPAADPPGKVVNLLTEFGEELEVEVGPAREFCLAANKVHVEVPPLPTPAVPPLPFHYKCYEIEGDLPGPVALIVDLETQFGLEPGALLGNASRLCLPAEKRVPPGPGTDWIGMMGLDHMKCYDILPGAGTVPADAVVNLSTQFGDEYNLLVDMPERLCVVVDKDVLTPTPTRTPGGPTDTPTPTATHTPTPTETPIADTPTATPSPTPTTVVEPQLHYVCNEIRPHYIDPPISMLVSTQFDVAGPEYVEISTPAGLCAPALKSFEGGPWEGDLEQPHFKCYWIDEGPYVGAYVNLHTQFGDEWNIQVGQASLLCTEAAKEVLEPEYQPPGPIGDLHYMCYTIYDHVSGVPEVSVDLETQFGSETGVSLIDPGYYYYLCAPALKSLDESTWMGDLSAPHYKCYWLEDAVEPEPFLVNLYTQFGLEEYIEIPYPFAEWPGRLLCVQADKEDVTGLTGACCLLTGGCQDDVTPAECSGMGGSYQGAGSTCADVVCIGS